MPDHISPDEPNIDNPYSSSARSFNELLLQVMRETGAGVNRMESKFDNLREFISTQNTAQQVLNTANGERMAKIETRLEQALSSSDKNAQLSTEVSALKTHVDGLRGDMDKRAETNKWVIGLIVAGFITILAAFIKGIIGIHI